MGWGRSCWTGGEGEARVQVATVSSAILTQLETLELTAALSPAGTKKLVNKRNERFEEAVNELASNMASRGISFTY